jgi:hypothetical protein
MLHIKGVLLNPWIGETMENEATVIEMVVFDCVSIARVFFILI